MFQIALNKVIFGPDYSLSIRSIGLMYALKLSRAFVSYEGPKVIETAFHKLS